MFGIKYCIACPNPKCDTLAVMSQGTPEDFCCASCKTNLKGGEMHRFGFSAEITERYFDSNGTPLFNAFDLGFLQALTIDIDDISVRS